MTIIDAALVLRRVGVAAVVLEELELNYQVRALVQINIDPDVARVFAFSNAERGAIISLARRKGVIR